MNHIRVIDGESPIYPYGLWRLQQDFPHTSFVQPFEENDLGTFGVFAVAESAKPDHDPITHRADELAPKMVGGVWTQQWSVVALPAEDAAFKLAQAKTAKNAEINASRLAANRGAFTHGGKSFACDELSRSDIDGITSFVTLAGALPPGWPGAWKAIDNSYLPISSVAEWAAFVASMVSAGNANFAKAQALKIQLAAATTTAQLNAITW